LEGWSLGYVGSRPQKISPNAVHSYQIRTADGVLGLTVGSRILTWQGMAFWLGYSPQLIRGQPHIHAIDALKTLLPLVAPLPRGAESSRILILDPGHGGRSVGTQNLITKQYEKEYTLDWAIRIKGLLATNGWTVILTRTNDVDVPIPDRIAIADRYKGDLFISLHFNSASPDREMSGLETYCLTPPGMPSSITREFEDDISAQFPNNAFDASNLQLSYQLHKELVRATGGLDRAVRRARFMGVLRGQNRPAVLIEGGYMSNPVEARKIASPAYRQKLAEAIAKALH
jgi:N-acetylmuramoyl-L-alanine amidase